MKKKKIGIVTISENVPNYGQRLQAYMVQQMLAELGYDSELIQDARWYNNPMHLKTYWKDIAHLLLRYHLQPNVHGFRIAIYWWIKKNLKVSKFAINTDEDLQKLPSLYDGFLVGSDQVWNPYFYDRGANSFTFLQFADPTQRIAYAASIATNEMVPDRVEEFKGYLKNFPIISMREESGARIIKEITGRDDIQVVLDPTLMLTGEQWASKFMRVPKQRNYLIVFLYYDLTPRYRRIAESIAEKKHLGIIYLNRMSNVIDYSVESWLGFIKYADHVITDSFHCVVFSTLFHKSITIIRHPETEKTMGMRVADLFERLSIQTTNRHGEVADTVNVNWDEVERILSKKRIEAKEFLEKAFPKQY